MDLKILSWVFFVLGVICLVCYPASVSAGDIVHDDDLSPKKPGCENDFVLVSSFAVYFFLFTIRVLVCESSTGYCYWWLSVLVDAVRFFFYLFIYRTS